MWVWHTTFARSIPSVVKGLAAEYSDIQHWKLEQYRERWGDHQVLAFFSDDHRIHRIIIDPVEGPLVKWPYRLSIPFAEYISLVQRNTPDEYVFVRSPFNNFSELSLPLFPPKLENVVKHTLLKRNLWVQTQPTKTILHCDSADSVLLQISGYKRFTLVDSLQMNKVNLRPVQRLELKRISSGVFTRNVRRGQMREIIPLVNVTDIRDTNIITIDLNPGDAILLPAYWYHEVDSFASPDTLNVAVNYFFRTHSLATRFYRTIVQNLFET